MKKDIGSYIPFSHDNFQFKKTVIDLARRQPATFEGIHVAALIYVNSVDYIAQHLLEHLMYMTYLVTNREFNCIIFFSQVKPEKVPLGSIIQELDKYEFPDKKDFMEGLREFVTIRNRLVHNLLSLSPEQLSKLDDDFAKIKELGEGLLNKYDNMTMGIKDAWLRYISKLDISGQTPDSTTNEVKEKTQTSTQSPEETEKSRNNGSKS